MPKVTLNDVKSEYRRESGMDALVRLLNQCVLRGITGGSAPILATLRALHNGGESPVDLELVCKRCEDSVFSDVISVLQLCHRLWPRTEMYNVFVDERLIEKRLYWPIED